MKSVAWTLIGSIGSLTLTMKSVGGTTMIIPHIGLFTVQPEGVGVGLGGTVAVGVGEAVAVAVAAGVGVGGAEDFHRAQRRDTVTGIPAC